VRIAVAVAALGGLLVWEAWSERARHRIKLLLERLPALFVEITVDFTAWQLAMVKMAEETAEAARHLEHWRERQTAPRVASAHGYTVTRDLGDGVIIWSPVGSGGRTQAPDDSWIDSHSDNGEELERLEQVIEEQRERIRRLR
jgi:hypothetical protein